MHLVRLRIGGGRLDRGRLCRLFHREVLQLGLETVDDVLRCGSGYLRSRVRVAEGLQLLAEYIERSSRREPLAVATMLAALRLCQRRAKPRPAP